MKEDLVRPSKDLNVTYIGNGEHLITLKNKYMEMSGADCVCEVTVLEGHILRKVELKHTTSDPTVESTDSLLIRFQRILEMLDSLPHDLFEETACVKSDKRIIFGKEYAYPTQTYRFTLNTTNTDRIYPEMYIALLPKLDEPTKPEVNICQDSIDALAEAIAKILPQVQRDC